MNACRTFVEPKRGECGLVLDYQSFLQSTTVSVKVFLLTDTIGVDTNSSNLCESVLGLQCSTFDDYLQHVLGYPLHNLTVVHSQESPVVCGITPTCSIVGYYPINLGDCIVQLDNEPVSLQSINACLKDILSQGAPSVNVTIKTLNYSSLQSFLYSNKKNSACLPDVTIMLKDETELFVNYLQQHPISLVVQSLDAGNVLYKYTCSHSAFDCIYSLAQDLHAILTKCDLGDLRSIQCNHGAQSLTFNTTINHDCESIMMLGMSSCSHMAYELYDLCDYIHRYLIFAYSDTKSAFTQNVEHGIIDSILSLMFYQHFEVQELYDELDLDFDDIRSFLSFHIFEPITLTVPDNFQLSIEDALSDLESANLPFPDAMQSRRLYTVIGCCLYFKDALLANHLTPDDLLDCNIFMTCQGYLYLSATGDLEDMIIWNEVFPTRLHHLVSETPTFGYIEPSDARYFILGVTLKNLTIVALLEAGGCSMKATGFPAPDACYVQQLSDVLGRLDTLGLMTQCKECYSMNGRVSPASGPLVKNCDILAAQNHSRFFQSKQQQLERSDDRRAKKSRSLSTIKNLLSPAVELRNETAGVAFWREDGAESLDDNLSLAEHMKTQARIHREWRSGRRPTIRPPRRGGPRRGIVAMLKSMCRAVTMADDDQRVSMPAMSERAASKRSAVTFSKMAPPKHIGSAVGSYTSGAASSTDANVQMALPPLLTDFDAADDTDKAPGLNLFDMSDVRKQATGSTAHSGLSGPVALSTHPLLYYVLIDYEQAGVLSPPMMPCHLDQSPFGDDSLSLQRRMKKTFLVAMMMGRQHLTAAATSVAGAPSNAGIEQHEERRRQQASVATKQRYNDPDSVEIVEEGMLFELPIYEPNDNSSTSEDSDVKEPIIDPGFRFWMKMRAMSEPKQQHIFVAAHAPNEITKIGANDEADIAYDSNDVSPLEVAYKLSFGHRM